MEPENTVGPTFLATGGDWQTRLDTVVASMREMSVETDPARMVEAYSKRMAALVHRDRLVTLSRRGHKHPEVRVTRDSQVEKFVNPWKEKDLHPIVTGGVLAELIYGDEPRLIGELKIGDDDPGREFLEGQRSVMAIPLFDQGVSMNMVLFMRKEPAAFRPEEFPEFVWMSNLFGRVTHNLVLSDELRRAYHAVDSELKAVADIQRSLLPAALPNIPTMDVAAHYETSKRAGGDYYDFFPLPDGRWGILIADVAGHGTPAAVLMAITHVIAHTHPTDPCPPGEFLDRLNRLLVDRYTGGGGVFVTAFYAVYDANARTLTYASAGHNAPRLKRCSDGTLHTLTTTGGIPLGIEVGDPYPASVQELLVGDQIVLYTDGITEAFDLEGEMFGTERLDLALANCSIDAGRLIQDVLESVGTFTRGRPADDDRTLLVAKIR